MSSEIMEAVKLSTIGTHRETAAHIADSLKSEMLSGELTPGQRLGEAALAERFSVSRGPVRDALSRLVEIGIAVSVPNVGTRVRKFSQSEARDLYELRESLEAEAAGLAAIRSDKAGKSRLADLTNVSEDRFGQGRQDTGRQDTDSDFHLELARMSENGLLLRLLSEQLYPQLMLLRIHSRNATGRLGKALNEHHGICNAVVDGDSELARILMRRHIRNSWKSFYDRMAYAEISSL
jgi:DNA-binding GntR family transcriptional regulator